ncbi:TrkH family potassium uptake protein [Oscillatoria laete-virens NRMC-F 0139]|nr:TrkH family potassium uptake protein [Oscillatoria laete-virens]MDL5054944.1 TrkH family potassium uptake protein [Oscillatoria laete-virens NRMC-F 0139]
MRQRLYLRQRYPAFLGYAGEIFVIIGFLYLVPLLLIPIFPDEIDQAAGFLLAGVPLIIIGALFWKRLAPKEPLSLSVQEGYVVVTLVWVIAILVSAIPFIVNVGLNFTQAVFESTSGWATVGLTMIDVTQASHLILFFRSFIQFAGGAGFAIIAVSVLAGAFGSGLSAAEGRTDQLAPHVRNSASLVLRIYLSYAVFGILALMLAGMDWFDAINHAFTALATGGFSTRPESIAYWNSPAVEAVLVVLMILGAVNFVVPYLLLQRKFRVVLRNGEIRFMGFSIVLAIVLVFTVVATALYPTVEKAIRVSVFEVVATATTTGLSTVDFRAWTDFGLMIMIILMLIGGGTGSTAGAIKQFRIYILYKSIIWEFRRAFMPQHMVNEPAIWQGEKRQLMSDRQVRQVALFIGLYFTVFLIGSGITMLHGYPFRESLFEFASTLGGVGVSIGITTAATPPTLLWTQSVAMVLGRLEFFTVIIGIFKIMSDLRIMFLQRSTR